MRIAMFSSRAYDRQVFAEEIARRVAEGENAHELITIRERLSLVSAVQAEGCRAVCLFVNDDASAPVLERLAEIGVELIAIRAAGCDNVDLAACEHLGLSAVRVAGYSPQSVAEHTVALLLALERRVHIAHRRSRDLNFALDGLVGRPLTSCRIGIVGTGRIGSIVARVMRAGFGCDVVAVDRYENAELTAVGVRYVDRDELLGSSDVVSLHAPLTTETRGLLDETAFMRMRPGAVVVNTSRGALIDTEAAIAALERGRLGGLALDVYEHEADWFFEDHSNALPSDPLLSRLLMFPNVLLTGHQAFLTTTALGEIARATCESFDDFEQGLALRHAVCRVEPSSEAR
ncbi:MAG: 2-hydroxyacid dehydrogenase [Thioalkalivibrionaceae bacterium]